MKKSTYLFRIVLLFFFGWMACQQPAQKAPVTTATVWPADSGGQICLSCPDSLVSPPKRGRELPFELAKKCFDEYDTVMSRHGFLPDSNAVKYANDPRRRQATLPMRQIDSFRVVTRSEQFLGTDMLCWLLKQSRNAFDTSKMVIELRYGMYSDAFFEGAARAGIAITDPTVKKGRVSVFLVPYIKGEDKRLEPPPAVYDFGGLQP